MPGQNPKTLITGATGFLGSHIAHMLHDQGHEIVIIKRKSSSLDRLDGISKNVNFLNLDSNLFDKLSSLNFDYFFHVATCYGRDGESEEQIMEVNSSLPLKILNSLKEKPILVNFGTSLPSSVNSYAKTKNDFVDKVKLDFPNLKLINLKLEHFFGPNDGKFINYLINSFKNEVKELALTEGTQVRDFIYYKDLLSALSLVLSSEVFGDVPIGSGNPYVLKDLIELIQEAIDNKSTKLLWGKVPYRESEVMHSVADISILKSIGWSQRYTFKEGIDEVIGYNK